MTGKNEKGTLAIVEVFLKAKDLEKKGHDVIHFDAGEPDFSPPKEVIDATIDALRKGKGRYTEASGIMEAKVAVSDRLNRKYDCDVAPSQILLTTGGRLALYYSLSLLKRGSKVGIFSPDWPAYSEMCDFLALRKQFFTLSMDKNWDIDVDLVKKSNCQALVLNYPNNPTGKILKPGVLEELVEFANKKGIMIISDEPYSDYVLGNLKFKSVLESGCSNYVLVTSLSKSYSMTGYRAGYAVSDEKTTARMSKVNSMILTSAPEFVQYAIKAAMGCDKYVEQKSALIRRRLGVAARALKKKLDAKFYMPDGAMYIFPRLQTDRGTFDSERFALELLDKHFVSVAPGTAFGKSFREHFRMTLLQDEKRIEEGIERMARLMKR